MKKTTVLASIFIVLMLSLCSCSSLIGSSAGHKYVTQSGVAVDTTEESVYQLSMRDTQVALVNALMSTDAKPEQTLAAALIIQSDSLNQARAPKTWSEKLADILNSRPVELLTRGYFSGSRRDTQAASYVINGSGNSISGTGNHLSAGNDLDSSISSTVTSDGGGNGLSEDEVEEEELEE